MSNPILTIPIALAGTWALCRGLWGRRVDDHPRCRRCSFDLTGRSESTTRCGECGADLNRPRAVRVGGRSRRPTSVVAGVVVLLAATAVGWPGASLSDSVQRHKPVWLLTAEVTRGGPARSEAASGELWRRIEDGQLRPTDVSAVADAVLTVQADHGKPWLLAWGDLIELLHHRGELSTAQWQRYVRQAIVWRMRVRPAIRQADPLPAEVTTSQARQGWGPEGSHYTPFHTPFHATITILASDGSGVVDSLMAGQESVDCWPDAGVQGRTFRVLLPAGPDEHVTLGHHRVFVRVHVGYRRGFDDGGPFDATDDVTLSAETTVVPDGVDTVGPADAAFVERVRRSVRVRGNPGRDVGRVTALVEPVGAAPGSFQFALSARTGDVEQSWGPFRTLAGGTRGEARDADATRLRQTDLTPVLRCPPALARDTVDQTMYFDGPVLLPDKVVMFR